MVKKPRNMVKIPPPALNHSHNTLTMLLACIKSTHRVRQECFWNAKTIAFSMLKHAYQSVFFIAKQPFFMQKPKRIHA
jgi:hypothetical protein